MLEPSATESTLVHLTSNTCDLSWIAVKCRDSFVALFAFGNVASVNSYFGFDSFRNQPLLPASCGAKMLLFFFFSQVVAGGACSRLHRSYLSYIQQQPADPTVRRSVFIFTSICFIAHSCVKYNRDAKLQPQSVCLCIFCLPLFILNWSV